MFLLLAQGLVHLKAPKTPSVCIARSLPEVSATPLGASGRRGHRYGVVGSNGSGKTTLMARWEITERAFKIETSAFQKSGFGPGSNLTTSPGSPAKIWWGFRRRARVSFAEVSGELKYKVLSVVQDCPID